MPDSLPLQLPAGVATTGAPAVAALAELFRSRRATVAVLGPGYVGLPLALALVEAGFSVLAFDSDPERIRQLAAGESPLRQIASEALGRALQTGRLGIGARWDGLAQADAVLVCVPTPLGRHREPDLSAVQAATRRI